MFCICHGLMETAAFCHHPCDAAVSLDTDIQNGSLLLSLLVDRCPLGEIMIYEQSVAIRILLDITPCLCLGMVH
ncbi:hypothetical protein I7I53_06563 [Histoplasma capsulatum var. duboisii H88]|uniref:Uncharacterized protein n=2 Tax=Ajellomyces capsulatus TaxID=5037 RepID=A0A8H8D7C7_AJECA|nr:hypothetical protein I7I52_01767 [Histoplasma capsulatum]QSS51283.1 hypothetical protein I7I53_06563 [Histoplasma capsulatum var. duboisii H88]QSS69290.1 hypothetical protein I7I50_10528 [Histoplasma capsulatum G186AR]